MRECESTVGCRILQMKRNGVFAKAVDQLLKIDATTQALFV